MSRPLLDKNDTRPRVQLSACIAASTRDGLLQIVMQLQKRNPNARIGQAIDSLVSKKRKPVKPSTAPRVQTMTQHGKA